MAHLARSASASPAPNPNRIPASRASRQSGLYLLQLGQSRRHEYEADQLALALGSAAGMDRRGRRSGGGASGGGWRSLRLAACMLRTHKPAPAIGPPSRRRSLVGGATDVLQRFMKMEAGAGLAGAVAASAGADSPLSTHPAAANRLRRLGEVFQRGGFVSV